jgi:cell fate (sporulation/competence/biofilm development) regulator YlbF (YheA/YmcA/DUF963 family)
MVFFTGHMDTKEKESGIVQKTLALCQAVTEQPDFQLLKGQIDAFMGDEAVKFQYQQVNDLGGMLQMKQGNGVELDPQEIAQFEALRGELVSNPVAQGFFQAQQQLQDLHHMVDRFLDKTFELGRPPEFDELKDGSCGNCDCH